jgi:hypothetical protein
LNSYLTNIRLSVGRRYVFYLVIVTSLFPDIGFIWASFVVVFVPDIGFAKGSLGCLALDNCFTKVSLLLVPDKECGSCRMCSIDASSDPFSDKTEAAVRRGLSDHRRLVFVSASKEV